MPKAADYELNLPYGPTKAWRYCFEGTIDLSAAVPTPTPLPLGVITRVTDLVSYGLTGDATLYLGAPDGPSVTLSKLLGVGQGISDAEIVGGIWYTTAGSLGGTFSYLALGR